MRKLLGIVAVLLLLSGCTSLDGQARQAFERERAVNAAILALQHRIERVPGVQAAEVGLSPATGLLDSNGSPTDKDFVAVRVTMPRVDNEHLVEVAAAVRDAATSGPLAAANHELLVQAEGREAFRSTDFSITDKLLLEALDYWAAVRALVDPALSLTIGYPSYGRDYSRIISAPADTPQITAAYAAAFGDVARIPDVTLGMPVVELTGFRLVGELPPAPVMETFGRIIPHVHLLSREYSPRNQGHVMFEWQYSPLAKSGAMYNVHSIQEVEGGEDDLLSVAAELARTAVGPTVLRSYLITRAGGVRFNCEPAEAPFPDDLTLVEWLRHRDVPVSVEANAGYCA